MKRSHFLSACKDGLTIFSVAALGGISACGGTSEEPDKVWVVGVYFVRGPNPPLFRFPDEGLQAMLRFQVPIYKTSCAVSPDPNGPTSNFIHRFLIPVSDLPKVVAGNFFQERESFESTRKIITEFDDCSIFFYKPPASS